MPTPQERLAAGEAVRWTELRPESGPTTSEDLEATSDQEKVDKENIVKKTETLSET